MKFRKVTCALFIIMLTGLAAPTFASNETPAANTEKSTKDEQSQQLTNRLIEIRNMDKSRLTSAEKKALRKEVKEIRREKRSNGVYLSVGAIIIIALLLILLL